MEQCRRRRRRRRQRRRREKKTLALRSISLSLCATLFFSSEAAESRYVATPSFRWYLSSCSHPNLPLELLFRRMEKSRPAKRAPARGTLRPGKRLLLLIGRAAAAAAAAAATAFAHSRSHLLLTLSFYSQKSLLSGSVNTTANSSHGPHALEGKRDELLGSPLQAIAAVLAQDDRSRGMKN